MQLFHAFKDRLKKTKIWKMQRLTEWKKKIDSGSHQQVFKWINSSLLTSLVRTNTLGKTIWFPDLIKGETTPEWKKEKAEKSTPGLTLKFYVMVWLFDNTIISMEMGPSWDAHTHSFPDILLAIHCFHFLFPLRPNKF